MNELKSISEIAKEIKDDRFLALFSAFVKALDSKDYSICKRLTIYRFIILLLERINFEYGLKIIYSFVLKELKKRDYFYWERKMLYEKLYN